MKRYLNKFLGSNDGFSLINILMGVAVMGIGSVGVMKFMGSQVEAVSNLETLKEISAIKRKIARKMNCAQTLNYVYGAPTLSCAAFSTPSLSIKTDDGKTMALGGTGGASAWNVKAKCESDELIVQILSGPKRRGDLKAWKNTKYGKDLFLGQSEFCKEFFDPNTPLNWHIGGYYTSYVKGGCRHANKITKSCSCPPKYGSFKILDFYDKECATDFFDQNFIPVCGAIQNVCLKLN